MIVLAIELDEAVIPSQSLAVINLPGWVKNKIVALSSQGLINAGTWTAYDESETDSQYVYAVFRKVNDVIYIRMGGLTTTKKRILRLNYDLLIDNAEPETQEQGE